MLLSVNAGCTPRTIVKKAPGPDDCGVRYYRPKPYLMIKPMVDKKGEPVEGYVSIETTTLPDYSEEYSIHVRSGLGSNHTSITLQDGWNLTHLNVETDSNIDANLKALAEIVEAVPTGGDIESATRVGVRGINVPLGLYEAVISNDGCTKRLYGFRYVGFMPFSGCPVEFAGCRAHSCEDGLQIYGLVFDEAENVMVFRQLDTIPGMKAQRTVSENQPVPIPNDDPNLDTENLPYSSF
jgi:hypothetical protein